MARVELQHLCKRYDNGFEAVRDLNLSIIDGEFLVLVGPSGCGKTTALRMIAGLEGITSGDLLVDGRRMNGVASRERDMAMVFQSYALYPHMTVAENIGFGLRLRKVDKKEIEKRVQAAAAMLGLVELLDRHPKRLSGGQRQRVAMGRAIVREPQVFLMDEPLSNLDAKMRVQTRAEIAGIQRRLGVTTVYVTHDQVEAMTMGDRVAVMKGGVLQQVDTPKAIYDHPTNLFVAGFIGSPAMSLCEAHIVREDEGCWVHVGGQRLAIDEEVAALRGLKFSTTPEPVVLGIRSEDMEDPAFATASVGRTLRIDVALTEALGSQVLVHFDVDAPRVFPDGTSDVSPDDADNLAAVNVGLGSRFVASFNGRSQVRIGDTMEVVIDTSHLHFFSPADGSTLTTGATAQ